MSDITQLLDRWRLAGGPMDAQLAHTVYPVLREIAWQQLRRSPDATLRATELAHEAYERLERQRAAGWQNRDHFYAIAATVVRRVLMDHLRARAADKRGAGQALLTLDDIVDVLPAPGDDAVDWLAVDAALTRLDAEDPDLARVVELRVFGGLTVEAIAQVMASSTATVGRQWRFAKAWLAEQLGPPG